MLGGPRSTFTSFTPGRQEGLDRQTSIGGSLFGIIHQQPLRSQQKVLLSLRLTLSLYHFPLQAQFGTYLSPELQHLSLCHLLLCISVLGLVWATGLECPWWMV